HHERDCVCASTCASTPTLTPEDAAWRHPPAALRQGAARGGGRRRRRRRRKRRTASRRGGPRDRDARPSGRGGPKEPRGRPAVRQHAPAQARSRSAPRGGGARRAGARAAGGSSYPSPRTAMPPRSGSTMLLRRTCSVTLRSRPTAFSHCANSFSYLSLISRIVSPLWALSTFSGAVLLHQPVDEGGEPLQLLIRLRGLSPRRLAPRQGRAGVQLPHLLLLQRQRRRELLALAGQLADPLSALPKLLLQLLDLVEELGLRQGGGAAGLRPELASAGSLQLLVRGELPAELHHRLVPLLQQDPELVRRSLVVDLDHVLYHLGALAEAERAGRLLLVEAGRRAGIMSEVFALPPSDSCRTLVSFESL
ncbi:unnamed protein product, partial [Prorocentrum cordatum]